MKNIIKLSLLISVLSFVCNTFNAEVKSSNADEKINYQVLIEFKIPDEIQQKIISTRKFICEQINVDEKGKKIKKNKKFDLAGYDKLENLSIVVYTPTIICSKDMQSFLQMIQTVFDQYIKNRPLKMNRFCLNKNGLVGIIFNDNTNALITLFQEKVIQYLKENGYIPNDDVYESAIEIGIFSPEYFNKRANRLYGFINNININEFGLDCEFTCIEPTLTIDY